MCKTFVTFKVVYLLADSQKNRKFADVILTSKPEKVVKHLFSTLIIAFLAGFTAAFAARPNIQRDTVLVVVPGNGQGVSVDEKAVSEEEALREVAEEEKLMAGMASDMLIPEYRAIWAKTNLVGWAVFQMNAAVEIELFNHFTLNLPIYYGTFNWFTETIKFNTAEFRPEFRYWFHKDCNGPFAAVHGTIGLYNYALGGEFRYQDHDGKTPAWGGGITLGWRFPVTMFGSSRWSVEVALGAAALRLNYDTFYNMKNGNYHELGVKKTYFGIDNVSVSLSYRFDTKSRFRR